MRGSVGYLASHSPYLQVGLGCFVLFGVPKADMQTRLLVTPDGIALTHRVFKSDPKTRRVAFVTHSQAQHTLNLRPTIEGIAAKGWHVHATDLRGHGHSTSARAPLAHMTMGSGWDHLVADLRLGLETAFDGVAWEDRLVVAPNIGGPLVLEILKSWPDLARQIVLVTPPFNQLAVWKLARSFTKARSLLHPQDKPDDLTMHQLYTFLGARLSDPKRLIDVMSSDRTITDALIEDPHAWPTPTTGYFHEMFAGIERGWKWPRGVKVVAGTSMLILFGGDDPITANGKFVEPMRRRLRKIGVERLDAHCIEGGRSGLIIDEVRLGISSIITRWADGEALPEGSEDIADMAAISSGVLAQMGLENFDKELAADELVDLCYTAINDESRWVEMLYRVAYAISADKTLDDRTLDAIIMALMPHWERSYNLNRQIMQTAAIGAVMQNVIDRFNIGMAVVSAEMDITYANPLFVESFASLAGMDAKEQKDEQSLSKALKKRVDPEFIQRCAKGGGEALFMLEGEAVGFHFRPMALRQTALNRGGPSGVLVLRSGSDKNLPVSEEKIELLQFAYGLTAKEAEAALGLLDGLSPYMIAQRCGVTINTTRTHLKRIYEKIGVQGQTELTARLLKGPIGLIATR